MRWVVSSGNMLGRHLGRTKLHREVKYFELQNETWYEKSTEASPKNVQPRSAVHITFHRHIFNTFHSANFKHKLEQLFTAANLQASAAISQAAVVDT